MIPSSGINALLRRYRSGEVTPQRFIQDTYDRIEQCHDRQRWTYLAPLDETLQRVTALTQEFSKSLPLYGIPFALQDTIDWGCVDLNRSRSALISPIDPSATIVKNLMAAGAIPLGKMPLESLPLEFVTFALGVEMNGNGLRSAIFALMDSDVDLVLKSVGLFSCDHG